MSKNNPWKGSEEEIKKKIIAAKYRKIKSFTTKQSIDALVSSVEKIEARAEERKEYDKFTY